jgi:hypothetical protein
VFLECDPRMMASQRACHAFGVNMAALLCARARGEHFPRVYPDHGRFLSLTSLPRWLMRRGHNIGDSRSPLRMGLRSAVAGLLR